jgi:hypothetical protein
VAKCDDQRLDSTEPGTRIRRITRRALRRVTQYQPLADGVTGGRCG